MTQPQFAGQRYGPGYEEQAIAQLAGFWRRFAAYLIDAIVFGVAAGIIEAIIAALIHASVTDTSGNSLRGGGVSFILGLLYFGFLWSRNGQTLGYMALDIRVVRADGQPLTWLGAIGRYILIYLSFAICLIPAIISSFMIGLGQRKQGIHDVILGQLVVRV